MPCHGAAVGHCCILHACIVNCAQPQTQLRLMIKWIDKYNNMNTLHENGRYLPIITVTVPVGQKLTSFPTRIFLTVLF